MKQRERRSSNKSIRLKHTENIPNIPSVETIKRKEGKGTTPKTKDDKTPESLSTFCTGVHKASRSVTIKLMVSVVTRTTNYRGLIDGNAR